MATSTYKYDSTDSLIKISDMYNTNIKTLVRLNPWLKDINDGHTYMIPSQAKTLQVAQPSSAVPYTIHLNVTPVYMSTVATCIYSNQTTIIFYEQANHSLSTRDSQEPIIFGTIDYQTNTIISNLDSSAVNGDDITLVRIEISYIPNVKSDYLIVPLIGNGNTSIEDYWQNLDSSVGISHKILSNTANDAVNSGLQRVLLNTYIAPGVANIDQQTMEYAKSQTAITSQDSVSDTNNFNTKADYAKLDTALAIQSAIDNINYSQSNSKAFSFSKVASASAKKISTYSEIKGWSKKAYGYAKNAKTTIKIGNTTLYLPCFPESVSDGVSANFNPVSILGRSEPFSTYSDTDARDLDFSFRLHREIFSVLKNDKGESYMDNIIATIESGVYPTYSTSLVAPQKTTVTVGNQIYISGVMLSQSISYSGPMDVNGKYNIIDISFRVRDIHTTPLSCSDVKKLGSYRK